MRRSIFAFGLLLLTVGAVLLFSSQVPFKPEPYRSWKTVAESSENSIEGHLTKGDNFKIYLSPPHYTVPLPKDFEISLNVTDPIGNTTTVFIPLARSETGWVLAIAEHKILVANHTGIHSVTLVDLPPFLSIDYLAIRKEEYIELELEYPYGSLFIPGALVAIGGLAVTVWSGKMSRRRRIKYKRISAE